MEKNAKIYIAGHRGLVGSAIRRKLEKDGYINIICKTHQELDLMDQQATKVFLEQEKPEYVFLAGAKVGGIMANMTQPAEYIYNNLQIQNNVIHYSYLSGVKKLIFLGSSCIYPKDCPQPIKEDYLLIGPLEPTNLPYAIAKIAGIKMCQSYNRQYGTNFISCMPTNLYGPNDNFDLNSSHVFPAMIRKFHEAKINNISEVVLWGDGTPYREFLHVDDVADAIVYLMDNFNPTKEQNETGDIMFNIGTGIDITIKDLAELMKKIIGYKGKISRDTSKPNGTPRKLMDVNKLHAVGWKHTISLEEGIKKTYEWFLDNYK
ncbi:MAG: GDP-L-fucose synthase [Candidatus Absconditabacterales bacterium]